MSGDPRAYRAAGQTAVAAFGEREEEAPHPSQGFCVVGTPEVRITCDCGRELRIAVSVLRTARIKVVSRR